MQLENTRPIIRRGDETQATPLETLVKQTLNDLGDKTTEDHVIDSIQEVRGDEYNREIEESKDIIADLEPVENIPELPPQPPQFTVKEIINNNIEESKQIMGEIKKDLKEIKDDPCTPLIETGWSKLPYDGTRLVIKSLSDGKRHTFDGTLEIAREIAIAELSLIYDTSNLKI